MGIYLNMLRRFNCSCIFLLPVLRITGEVLRITGFMNSFLSDARREDKLEGVIYLLFKPGNLVAFNEFVTEQRKIGHVVDDYDYGDFAVVIFRLPEKWKSDYELFYKGKYSQFSDEYKMLFPQVHKVEINGLRKDEISTQWCVFKKDRRLIEQWEEEIGMVYTPDQELWDAPSPEKETLTEEYLVHLQEEIDNL